MPIVKFVHFISHLHTEFTEIGGLLLICGSSIASKASNWATEILK